MATHKPQSTPIKITFVGEATVGKTSFVRRLTTNMFADNTSSTIGAAFAAMRYPNENGQHYHIWDTAGQERYNSLIPLYLSGATIIVVLYDITSAASFDRLRNHWFPFIRKNLRLQDNDPLPMLYLLGNKLDLVESPGFFGGLGSSQGNTVNLRQVATHQGKEFADEHGMPFMEVSAKTGDNVAAVFKEIHEHVKQLQIQRAEALRESDPDSVIRLTSDDSSVLTRATSCCSGVPTSAYGWWSGTPP